MKRFELKAEHLKLLKQSCWRWEDCEYGAPAMDCKRPFGNSSVIPDVMEILGVEEKKCPHCGESLDETDREKYDAIFRELEIAIQCIFHTLSFELGWYVQTSHSRWEKEKTN